MNPHGWRDGDERGRVPRIASCFPVDGFVVRTFASRARDADRRSVAGARCEANGRAPASARTVAGRTGVARGRVRLRASQGWRPRRSRRTSWIHRAFGHSERVLGVFMSVCNCVHLRDFGRNQTCAGALWNVSENILRRSARSHLEISARSSPRGRRRRGAASMFDAVRSQN